MEPAGLPPAQAAYLRLAGPIPADAELLAGLGAEEWATVRALARHDGVTAPVWHRVEAGGVLPPAEVAAAMRREAQVAEFHARRMAGHLEAVLAALAGVAVRPILLKGSGLALTAYPGFAERPMSDLDLLVEPEELEPARAALGAVGWRPERASEARYSAHHHDMPLTSPDGAVVELHHELLPAGHPFGLDRAWVAAAARTVAAPWGEVRVPSAADQLLHCCVHFAWSHQLQWGAWRAISDVAALLAADGGALATEEAAARLARRAIQARAGTAVYWTLRLAEAAGGVAVPAALLASVRPRLSPRRERWLLRGYAQQLVRGAAPLPSTTAARLLWRVGMQPSASGHGAARPWDLGGVAGPVDAGADVVRPPVGSRVVHQLGQLRAWRRWWRATREGPHHASGRSHRD